MVNQQDFDDMGVQEEPVIRRGKSKKKSGNLRKLLVALVISGLIGVGAMSLMSGKIPGLASFASQDGGSMMAETEDKAFYTAIPKITVNLLSGNGQDEFVKIGAVLEYSEAGMDEVIFARQARIIDSFTSLLRNLRVTDIKGSAGTQLLREELTKRANITLHPHAINTVRFEEIIIQ